MSDLQEGATAHPGQLTSIMRTVSLDGPQGLRVALVIDGKVVMERTFSEPAKVTVGPAERDTFVLFDDALPERITLFAPTKAGFELCIPVHGAGRIGAGGETLDVADWRARGTQRLPVSSGARGRLSFGRAAILFSYGPLPKVVAAAQLAPAMKRSIGIDWTTTMVAAVSFLVHFGALGAIYSDWADPMVDDNLVISKLVESVRQLPAVPPVEEQSEAQPTETAAAATITSKPSKDMSEKKSSTMSGQRVSARAPGSMSERDAKSLSNELASLDMQMLVGLNSGASTEAVISRGNIPASLLDEAAMNGSSSRKPGQLDMSSKGGAEFDGPRDLATLGNNGRGDGNRGPGTAQSSSARPRGGIDSTPPLGPGPGEIPGLGEAIGRLQGGFRRCYQNGLDRENPDMAGGVRVTVKIGPNGDVMSATPSVSGSLSSGVVSCMVGKIQGAQFPKTPSGSPAVFVVPISVKKQ